ncbi:MAG TPA: hypothetical protein VGA47_00920 [Candidatus Dormibacteraeota bacterium]
MRRITLGLAAGRPAVRRAVARLTGTRGLVAGPGSLAAQIAGLADALVEVLDQAATRGLVVPPAITNGVHELRGWAFRVNQGTASRPAAVDATRLLAYLRGLPDQQLLALLADLPWTRLDTLLDAVNLHQPPSPSGRPPT